MNQQLSHAQHKDIKLLAKFTEVWCCGHHHHARQPHNLGVPGFSCNVCPECAEFVLYAVQRRLHCPIEAEKPSCKHCHIHCYSPHQRALVKKIMAWSGKRLLLRGRLDYLWHYFF